MLFWTAADLENKLLDFRTYFNNHRTHTSGVVGRSAGRTSCFTVRPDLFVIYKTSHPDLPSPELNRVVTFDALDPKSKHEYPWYGVAVWRTKEPQTGDTAYWCIVLECPWSSSVLRLSLHGRRYDRKNWEKPVAPQCRSK
jgi:hypothetical protein